MIKRHRFRGGIRLCVLGSICLGLSGGGRAQQAGTALYVRTDSDETLVVAPRLRVQVPISEATRASLVYAVDVWTSASIDIMASASQVPVTEQRDEVDLSLDHELEDVIFTAAYRYSTEPDYVSHGGSGGFSYDFADNNATLAVGLSASSDSVGKAGDPDFSRGVGTLGGRLSFTQVLGVDTVLQVMYEVSRVQGYQASPYRFVAIGPGRCTIPTPPQPETVPGAMPVAPLPAAPLPAAPAAPAPVAPLCVPENSPGERLRHAVGLELRHALGAPWSVGVAYRFYTDDWGLTSHTARGDLTWLPETDTILAARYRFYTQGKADHYQAQYAVPQPYLVSDKELSPLSSHRIALELDQLWRIGGELTTALSVAPIFYSYRDFIPLDSITAFEVTAAVGFVP